MQRKGWGGGKVERVSSLPLSSPHHPVVIIIVTILRPRNHYENDQNAFLTSLITFFYEENCTHSTNAYFYLDLSILAKTAESAADGDNGQQSISVVFPSPSSKVNATTLIFKKIESNEIIRGSFG